MKILTLLGDGTQGASAAGWHAIEDYMKCPKRYQFAKVRGIGKPMAETPAYFAVGALVHAGRAVWLASGCATDAEVMIRIDQEMEKVLNGYELPVAPGALAEAKRYVTEYIDHYVGRAHPRCVGAEYDLGPADIGDGEVRTARLDDVSFYPEAANQLCIGELKTTGSDIATTMQQYELHGQPILQTMLWKAAAQGEALHGGVSGVMLDVLQKGYKGKKCQFARKFIEVTDLSRQWFAKSLAKAIREAREVTWDSEVERRISSCTEMQGSRRVACPFRDLCQHGRSASLEFVTKDGNRLIEHKPVEGQERMPWE